MTKTKGGHLEVPPARGERQSHRWPGTAGDDHARSGRTWFGAGPDGAVSWEWVEPDGLLIVSTSPADELELEAQRTGDAVLQVPATDERGEIVEASRPLDVVD